MIIRVCSGAGIRLYFDFDRTCIVPTLPKIAMCDRLSVRASSLDNYTLSMPHTRLKLRREQLVIAAAYLINVVGVATQLYSSPLYWKQPYHTSKLTGAEWVKELINGHHDRIWTELGMWVHVFLAFVHELRVVCGLEDGKYMKLDEQAAIFLYMCVTGLSVRHVGERFQRSNDSVSK